MKIVTLIENTACREGLTAGHGLSLYIETPRHKLLVDMGPDAGFLTNAEKLGVDLTAVDIAILSHGHYDHSGGLRAFLELNKTATVYLQEKAFGDYVVVEPDGSSAYIGIDPALRQYADRIVFTKEALRIDEELQLFNDVTDTYDALRSSAKLYERTAAGLVRDAFAHEQDLVITAGGKTVLVAGCAHRGIVNILRRATERLGHAPDVTFGGFHLFQLEPGDPASDSLITMIGKALLPGNTVYHTGHCTGEYAYEKLKEILGDRLQPMVGGSVTEL